jgi:carbonic anhydrase/acetyltransferase-like protein (isoleucine patch superfamily)
MPVLAYLEHTPRLSDEVSVAEGAVVVGRVSVRGAAVIRSSAVLRGDQSFIEIDGPFHIGQGSTIHTEVDVPTRIGSGCWLGDGAVVHASVLGSGVRVEDGGLVLSYSRLGAGSIVAAGSLVAENSSFEANSYISGVPGRRLRDTTAEERAETARLVERTRGRGARPDL